MVEEKLAMEDTDDVYKLSKMTDILHALFVTYKTDFFQYFDLIVHQFAKLLVCILYAYLFNLLCILNCIMYRNLIKVHLTINGVYVFLMTLLNFVDLDVLNIKNIS